MQEQLYLDFSWQCVSHGLKHLPSPPPPALSCPFCPKVFFLSSFNPPCAAWELPVVCTGERELLFHLTTSQWTFTCRDAAVVPVTPVLPGFA